MMRFTSAGTVEMRVYDTANNLLAMMASPADPTGTNFLGVWSPIPIGRVNLFATDNGAEGMDNIQAWEEGSQPCPWDLDNSGSVGTNDLLILFSQWGQVGSADFDGGGVSTSDLLILFANWGPCP